MFSVLRLVSSISLALLCFTTASASPRQVARIPSDASLLAPFRKLPNSALNSNLNPSVASRAHISTTSDATAFQHHLPPSHSVAAMVYPVMGPRKSSSYGMRSHPKLKTKRHHHGVDLAAPAGAPIRAISSGTVIFADPWGGYGNLVVVKHTDGKTTSHYGHCKTLKVRTGERIAAGKIIATVGSTGISTGPHLHFEVRVSGKPDNPEKFLPGLADESAG